MVKLRFFEVIMHIHEPDVIQNRIVGPKMVDSLTIRV